MSKPSINKVLIADAVDEQAVAKLTAAGVQTVVKTGQKEDDIAAMIQDFDGIIVRSATKVTGKIIAAGTNLKVIGRAGVGVDNIDVPAATKNNVLVVNAPGGNTLSAVELTCLMILDVTRNCSKAAAKQKERNKNPSSWDKKSFEADRKEFKGTEVHGKTLAIIGLGRIGFEVGMRMKSFGMNIVGYDPIESAVKNAESNGIKCYKDLNDIWPIADHITVHVPLIKQTENLINGQVMSKCKKGVFLINVARGGIIDEAALLDGLNSGQVGGAALDVFVTEPPANVQALIAHKNLVATPHLGASTAEAQVRVAVEIAEQFIALRNGTSAADVRPHLSGAVNPDTLNKLF